MAEKVTFPSNGGTAHGYLALPESGSGPGVIVIQEWWGLVDHIIDVTDRLAGEGFVALAPDLFGGKTTHDAQTAGKYLSELPVEQAARDLSGAVDYLLSRDEVTSKTVGAVGFCMGGGFVLLLAHEKGDQVSVAVACYPANGAMIGDLPRITAAVEIHAGGKDDFVNVDAIEQLAAKVREQSGAQVAVQIYPDQGHAFLNDENLLGTYDKEAAGLLWTRIVDSLKANVS